MDPAAEARFESVVAELHDILVKTNEDVEGNCVYTNLTLERNDEYSSKRRNLYRLAKESRKICEIGFNAGHSASLLMMGSQTSYGAGAECVFFDLGQHRYTTLCFEKLKQMMPSVSTAMYLGDSRVLLPRWIEANKDQMGTFDMVHVDGGHSMDCAASDLLCAVLLTRPGGVIVVDDVDSKEILPVVNTWMLSGYLSIDLGYESTEYSPHVILRKALRT
jgi:hypothetical protein